MSTREEFLSRVRKALGRSGEQPPAPPPLDLAGVLPPLAPSDYLSKFEAEWQKVAGVAYRVANPTELESILEKILAQHDVKSVVLSANPWLAELQLAQRLSRPDRPVSVWTGDTATLPAFQKTSFTAGVGITGVDLVLAESGTLVLSSRSEGAQMTSMAPPVHIALYRQNQLVGSLEDVLARLPVSPTLETAPGRSVVFVTGTSRTADIEQILIRGVHGPREAYAILVES